MQPYRPKKRWSLWWIIIPLLGLSWAFPMLGLRQSGVPWWFFMGCGIFWYGLFIVTEPLYEWGIRLRRRLGLQRLAEWGERMKPEVLPPTRWALLFMAGISFGVGLWQLVSPTMQR